jgi:uncharacterized membrane protein
MAQTIVQILSPPHLRGRLIGLFSMTSMGLKAFSGVTVGVAGGLIGVHWSLALSAIVLLAVTLALFAFATPGRRQGEFG